MSEDAKSSCQIVADTKLVWTASIFVGKVQPRKLGCEGPQQARQYKTDRYPRYPI